MQSKLPYKTYVCKHRLDDVGRHLKIRIVNNCKIIIFVNETKPHSDWKKYEVLDFYESEKLIAEKRYEVDTLKSPIRLQYHYRSNRDEIKKVLYEYTYNKKLEDLL